MRQVVRSCGLVIAPSWRAATARGWEVDLELDILRSSGGSVQVRDREEFDRVREAWAMPDDIAAQAAATCEQIRALVEQGAEPFGTVGRAWLSRFLAEAGTTRS